MIVKTIKKSHKDSYHQELQNTINMRVLEQLFYLTIVKNQYQQVPAIVQYKLGEIKSFLEQKQSEGTQKIYDASMVKMIDNFIKNPTSFQKTITEKIPDGSPIGSNY